MKNPFSPRKPTPTTRPEWQVAADLANHVLFLEQARRWGLIGPDGKANVELCEEYLSRAQGLTIIPRTIGPAPGSPSQPR